MTADDPLAPSAARVLAADRERIARDLHDRVIQRLFAAGLSLQSQLKKIDDPEVHGRVDHAIGEIDRTIADLRSTIYDLTSPTDGGRSLRGRIADIAAAVDADDLGPRISVTVAGPVDTVVGVRLADDVEATVRESVSNAVKYAHATTIKVRLAVRDRLELTVADDGCGMPANSARGGLKNLAQRAMSHGGELVVDSVVRQAGGPGGTTVRFTAPLA